MEAELERQAATFRTERKRLTTLVKAEEDCRKEIEKQFKQLRAEVSLLVLTDESIFETIIISSMWYSLSHSESNLRKHIQ